ncbi:MAG: zf-HC2 domain-containing protein [Oscillospiraceae bacterium]|nr:zf-HC2 domain-containing protein [Oscillospiraceae bacterium]
MKECTKIYELLSAYSDNEVTDSERLLVDRHLAACKDCSAMLEMFRDISDAVSEPHMEVPEALRIGVMNRVKSESVLENLVVSEAKDKHRKRFGIMLTRFVPIAACLAVVVLVWQFWGNTGSIDFVVEAPVEMMDMAPEEAAPEAVVDESIMDDAVWAEHEVMDMDMDIADADDERLHMRAGTGLYAALYGDLAGEAEYDATYVDQELFTFRAEVLELTDVLVLEFNYNYEFLEAILLVSNITPVRHPGIGGSYLIVRNDYITVLDINDEIISPEDIPVGAIVDITFFGEILITYPSIIYHVTAIQIVE